MADITTDQNYPNATLKFTNARGEEAPVDGTPAWASSNDTVLKATPSDDGMKAVINTVGPSPVDGDGNPIGTRISATADADLGAGVKTLTIVSEDIFVTIGPNSQASIMVMDLGAPAEKA